MKYCAASPTVVGRRHSGAIDVGSGTTTRDRAPGESDTDLDDEPGGCCGNGEMAGTAKAGKHQQLIDPWPRGGVTIGHLVLQ